MQSILTTKMYSSNADNYLRHEQGGCSADKGSGRHTIRCGWYFAFAICI